MDGRTRAWRGAAAAVLAAAWCASVCAGAAAGGLAAAEAQLSAGRAASRIELWEFLRIPSVSSQRARAADVARAADWLVARLTRAGLQNAVALPTAPAGGGGGGGADGGVYHPVVYADWMGADDRDAPTVLVYGHYDVQPEEPVDKWTSPPFEPTVRGDNVYARGASDDKGHLYVAIAAVEAWLRAPGGGALPVNVKFVLEGEEEIGSPHLRQFLEDHRDRLAADYALSADGGQVSPDQPGLCLGLRGSVALQVDVFGAASDGHSGTFGGGVANPLHALSEMLASLHRREDGGILVAGMYDDVVALSEGERADFERYARAKPAEDVLASLGANTTFGEDGFSFYERTWARPSLEVVGMWGGYQGDGIKTVLPSSAHAKLSARLVANQDPDAVGALIERHLAGVAEGMPGVRAEVTRLSFTAKPYLMSKGGAANRAASRVLTEVYGGVEPLYFRMGGSIPVMDYIRELLGVEPVMFAFGHNDENVHAPDEYARLSSFDRGELAYVRLFQALADEHAVAAAAAAAAAGKEEL